MVVIVGEDLTTQVDGIQTVFIISGKFAPNTEAVYLNGLRQYRGEKNDYVPYPAEGKIKFNSSIQKGDCLIVDYTDK